MLTNVEQEIGTNLKASMMDGDWCFLSVAEFAASGCGSIGTMGDERRANKDHGRSVRERVAADFCSDLKSKYIVDITSFKQHYISTYDSLFKGLSLSKHVDKEVQGKAQKKL